MTDPCPGDPAAMKAAGRAAVEWLSYRRRTARIPGVQVAVRVRGELVLSEAIGVASITSGRPLTTEDVMRVASHSKTFTATLAVQLADEGALRLDDRISSWLHWVPDGDHRLGRATLRQALAHASGAWRDGAAAPHWSLDAPFPSDHDTIRAMASVAEASVLPPGDRFKYSNVAYSLLGLIIEAAAGRTYNELAFDRLIRPLGLRNTFPDIHEALSAGARLTAGHSSSKYGAIRIVLPDVATGLMASATGFCSTAADLTRWFSAHRLGSGELLPDPWKREMQTGLYEVAGGAPGDRYGLGLSVLPVGERTLIGHGGAFPGFLSSSLADPTAEGDGLAVSVLTNAIDAPAAAMTTGVAKIFAAALSGAAPHGSADESADRYCGIFFSAWSAIIVARLGQRLVAFDAEPVDPLAVVSELEVVDDENGVLRIADAAGYGSPGERIRYSFAADGSVESIQFAAAELRPWPRYRAHFGVAEEDPPQGPSISDP